MCLERACSRLTCRCHACTQVCWCLAALRACVLCVFGHVMKAVVEPPSCAQGCAAVWSGRVVRGVQGSEVTAEVLNYKRTGERFWNLLSMTPVRDAAGRVMSYIGVQSDITELVRRKEAEKELQEAKARFCSMCYLRGRGGWECELL